MRLSGMGACPRFCGGVWIVVVLSLVTLHAVPAHSQNSYTQTSLNLQSIFPQVAAILKSQFPDPDSNVTDRMFLFNPMVVSPDGDETFLVPPNVFRRNPVNNTYSSTTYGIYQATSQGTTVPDPNFLVPLWGNNSFVGFYTQPEPPDPNPNDEHHSVFATIPYGSLFS
ncbi:MAG: hypothetical protein ACREP8_10835, partial [Candidatus Binatia bacterium]